MIHCCADSPAEFRGFRASEVPELSDLLEEVSRDALNWTILYRCRKCGQEWFEEWEVTGHGEIPVTRKVLSEAARPTTDLPAEEVPADS